ncbi:MAG: AI-2E family transporter [Eubacteriales bacterium]|nr:AI-2E family transporter [Eubacteriales bacterium]
MELSRDSIREIKRLIVFTAILFLCLWKHEIVFTLIGGVFHVILPFVLGGAIAFVLGVPMNFIEKRLFPEYKRNSSRMIKKIARPVSLIIILFLLFAIISVVLFVLIPQLGKTIANLGDSVQEFLPKMQIWAEKIFHNNQEIMEMINSIDFDWNKIMDMGIRFLKNGAANMLGSTMTVVRGIISSMATFFIAFAFACYILLQKERLKIQGKKILFAFLPRGRAEAALEVMSLTYHTFSGFLTGQCLEAIILGSMFVVVLTVFHFPYALLLGIVIAFTALVPVFGAFVGCAIGVFLIFIVDPVKAILFVAVFLVLQQIEGNFIYPHVVGNSVGLPSIWVLAAVSIGGSLMGIVGMLIFIPLASVIYALFREVVYLMLRKREVGPEEFE